MVIQPSPLLLFSGLLAQYDHRRINTGIPFQQAHEAASASTGIWHDKDFHYTAIHPVYKLF
jgi:hypothetical protein